MPRLVARSRANLLQQSRGLRYGRAARRSIPLHRRQWPAQSIRAGLDAVGHDGIRRAIQRRTPSPPAAMCQGRKFFAPIAIRQRPRSSISGSRATLPITLSPRASVAAISGFRWHDRDFGKSMWALLRPPLAVATHSRHPARPWRPTFSALSADPPAAPRWRSRGQRDLGLAERANSGASTWKLARILRTMS